MKPLMIIVALSIMKALSIKQEAFILFYLP